MEKSIKGLPKRQSQLVEAPARGLRAAVSEGEGESEEPWGLLTTMGGIDKVGGGSKAKGVRGGKEGGKTRKKGRLAEENNKVEEVERKGGAPWKDKLRGRRVDTIRTHHYDTERGKHPDSIP